jgi:hypothetical protein
MSTTNGSSISAESNPATDPKQLNRKITDRVWKPVFLSPPAVKVPYDPREALDDIPGVSYALEQFLASRMVESEEYCHKMDETKFVHILWASSVWLTFVNLRQGETVLCHGIRAYPVCKRIDVLC